MKELKTMTEYEVLNLVYHSLLERIVHEEEVNDRTKKDYGRDNLICKNRLKKYYEQLREVRERILEIEHNQ